MPKTKPELVGLYRYPVPQAGRYDRLRLDKNENTIGFSPETIQRMLGDISPHFLAAYPEPGPLYEKIAQWHGVSVKNVLISAGSEMAIRYLFEAYLGRGDEIIYLNPSFAMFEVYARLTGASSVMVDYDTNLSIDVNRILERISSKTKIIAIANPNNPTGTVIPEFDLCRVLRHAQECDALVLIDEAYYFFCTQTMLGHLKNFSNLVVTRTFSKACGLAGARLGYAIAHESTISEMQKMQPIDHASAFALKVGEYLLDHQELIWDYVEKVKDGKKYLMHAAAELGYRASPSFANFVLIDVAGLRERVLEEFDRCRILVGAHVRLPFSNNYIRITVGPVEHMEQVVLALRCAVQR